MTGFPESSPVATPLHISTHSRYSIGCETRLAAAGGSVAAKTWTTNVVAYIPLSLPFNYPVRRVWWVNGSTIGNNVDMGIYTRGGAQLYHTGSTAQVGASSVQYVALGTDVVLVPGMYYLAWTTSGTTNTAFTTTATAVNGRQIGLLQETTAIPLPATMTPVIWALALGAPFCGLTRTSTGF